MDESNPAVRNQLALSPARLEEISTDKAELLKLVRKLQAINALTVHQDLKRANATLATKISFGEQLTRMSAQIASEIKEEKARTNPLPAGERLGVVFNFITNGQPQKVEILEQVQPTNELVSDSGGDEENKGAAE